MVMNDYRQADVRVDIRGVRISAEEIVYYTGLVLWLAQFYMSRTIYADFYGGKLPTAVRYFCMLLFMIKIVMTEKTVWLKSAAVFLTTAAVFVVVQLNINTGMPLIQVLLLIVGAREIPFKRLCKVILWSCVVLWIIPVVLDRMGMSELTRHVYRERVREYLNFNYVSYAAIYFNNILFCSFYVYTDPDLRGPGGNYARRREISWPVLAFMAGVVIWIFMITDTSLPFAIALLYILLYVAVIKLRAPVLNNNLFNRIAAVLLFPVLALITYLICKNYKSRVPIMKKLNQLSHTRIELASQGLKQYGVHLFGIQIKENTDTTKGAYFYIDSGYIKNLINYGLIVLIMILVFYSIILYAAVIERDKVLIIWMICIAIYSMFNNLLLSPTENGSILAIWYALDLIKWHREKKGLRTKRKRIEYGTQP